jgi:hypothetical protein
MSPFHLEDLFYDRLDLIDGSFLSLRIWRCLFVWVIFLLKVIKVELKSCKRRRELIIKICIWIADLDWIGIDSLFSLFLLLMLGKPPLIPAWIETSSGVRLEGHWSDEGRSNLLIYKYDLKDSTTPFFLLRFTINNGCTYLCPQLLFQGEAGDLAIRKAESCRNWAIHFK